MKILMYLRVSTSGQDLAPQRAELEAYCRAQQWTPAAGTEVREYQDVISGTKAARPGLDALLASAVTGDVVLVVKLDRLGRSVLNVVGLIEKLDGMGVGVVCASQGIDTRAGSSCGRMILGVMASFAQFERDLIRERTVAGLVVARANGKVLGRPSKKAVPVGERAGIIAQWKAEGGTGLRALASRLGGVSIATASVWAKSYSARV